MQQLTSAITAGDVQGAQTAYAALTNLQQNSGKSASTGPLATFLSSVGADLSKGDITGAQSTLTTLKAAHGKHHHHAPPAASGDNDNDASSSTVTASTSGATPTASNSNILDISA